MSEERIRARSSHDHLAGIIPVAGGALDFGFEWPECMMPIGRDLVAIEKCLMELARAGCKTIWIICNDDIQPLLKYRIGEWLKDPESIEKGKFISIRMAAKYERKIPIFYIPIKTLQHKTMNSFAWSVIYGATVAHNISRNITKWISPTRFYVSFPYGVYSSETIDFSSRNVMKNNKTVLLSYKGQTVEQGLYTGFIIIYKDVVRIKKKLLNASRKTYSNNIIEVKNRSVVHEVFTIHRSADKYVVKDVYTLDDVFQFEDEENIVRIEIPWYYTIDSWETYCKYMESKEKREMIRSEPILLPIESKRHHRDKTKWKYNPIRRKLNPIYRINKNEDKSE